MSSVIKSIDSPRDVRSRVRPEEWEARVQLAACYRLCAHYGWTDLIYTHVSARVPGANDPHPVWRELFANPEAGAYSRITVNPLGAQIALLPANGFTSVIANDGKLAITVAQPACSAMRAATSLVTMPPEPNRVPGVPASGACHTKTPIGMVIAPTRIEASQAVMRSAASMNRSANSGTREINTLSHTCPVGSSICSNIAIFLSFAMRRSRSTHLRRTRLEAGVTLPEFQYCSVRLEKSGQRNITTRSQVNREIR